MIIRISLSKSSWPLVMIDKKHDFDEYLKIFLFFIFFLTVIFIVKAVIYNLTQKSSTMEIKVNRERQIFLQSIFRHVNIKIKTVLEDFQLNFLSIENFRGIFLTFDRRYDLFFWFLKTAFYSRKMSLYRNPIIHIFESLYLKFKK